MRILVVGYMHAHDDKRVLKTVKAFSKQNEVYYQYMGRDVDIGLKNVKILPIERTFPRFSKRNVVKILRGILVFDNRVLNIVKKLDFDIIYIHGFPFSNPVGIFKVARSRGKRIVFDIHEYYPYQFMEHFIKGEFLKRLRTGIMWRIFKKQIELSEKLVFVTSDVRDEVFEILKMRKPSIVIPNYADLVITPKYKEKSICYVGKTPRSLKNEMELLSRLISRGFVFKLIGSDAGNIEVKHLKIPFLPYGLMMREISKCYFSLVSYDTAGSYYKNDLYALPHKFYDSLAAGTPVIVRKDFISMARIVREKGVGIVIDPKDVEESVKKILDASSKYDILIENIERHKSEFVWDEDKEKEFLSFVLGG